MTPKGPSNRVWILPTKYLPKILVLTIFLAGALLVYIFDLHEYLNLEYIKRNQEAFQEYYRLNSLKSILLYFFIYVVVTTLSLPLATVLTLLGAALFGFTVTLILTSLASTIGATLAFLSSRYLFRDFIQKKFSENLKTINEGMAREGGFYLVTLRLLPIFPFFMINLLMGLTHMGTVRYFFFSMLAMLPGTAVYVNAGTQLSQINAVSDIMSLKVLGSFALLGLFPLVVKKLIEKFKRG